MFDTTIMGKVCGHAFHALTVDEPKLGAIVRCAVCKLIIELAPDNAITSETTQGEWDEFESWEQANLREG
jgi:hypothetical protein